MERSRFFPPAPRERPPAWVSRTVLAVLVAGCVLRALRLTAAGFEPDEYFTLLARERILATGVPVAPSGEVYAYGGWLLWPGAAAMWAGGMGVAANRLLHAILGGLTIWVAWRTAQRLVGSRAAVVAAAAVALHPGLVQWSGHVKVYGALTLVTALAVDRWAAWALEDDDGAAWPFALWFSAAALCHPVVAFLAPALALPAIVRRGRAFAVSRRTLAVAAVCGASIVAFAAVMLLGDPFIRQHVLPGADEGLRHRILGLDDSIRSHGWGSAWHAVPFVLAVAGLLAALLRIRSADGAARAGLAFATAWAIAFTGFALFSRHQGAMYLLPMFPLLALPAAYGAATLLGAARRGAPILAVALLATHGYLARTAFREALDRREGMARMFARIAEQSLPGDVSFGGGPAVHLHTGGHVTDHLLFAEDSGLGVRGADGRRVDRSFGLPILGDVESVREVFDAAPGAWFVLSDKERGDPRRVAPEVVAWLTARMTLVEQGDRHTLYHARRP